MTAALDLFLIVFFIDILLISSWQIQRHYWLAKTLLVFSVTHSEYRIYLFFSFDRITVMLLKFVFYTGMANRKTPFADFSH